MTKEIIDKLISDMYRRPLPDPRQHYTIMTGSGGKELMDIAFEKAGGVERCYFGKKVPRIIRRLKKKIHQDRKGRYYKLIKI